MINDSSNEFWKGAANYQSFELRSHRFRDEMLPVFFRWLGIKGDSNVLDGGCGSGVFTRYLAKGLTAGHITGLDINETFICFGKEKIRQMGFDDKITLEVADGFHLHYPDNHFDAVTNYTYIGVLSDKKAGLDELVRVCKKGGTVSCVIATNAITRVGYEGGYPFEGASKLQLLSEKEWAIFSGIQRVKGAGLLSELSLFISCGLTDIHMYPFSHLICYSDTNFPAEYRKTVALEETAEEIMWLKSRYEINEKIYEEKGFSHGDYADYIALLETKQEYIKLHFDTDNSYEWHGGFNYIVAGFK
jgi:ubiquinone/menaquinone biosynthesis C-methylase UbiE